MLAGMALPVIVDEAGELEEAGGSQSLTELQRRFVVAYVAGGGNASEAARQAGYAEHSAGKIGGKLTRLPHVMAAMKLEQRRYLQADLMALALQTVRGILSDPDAPRGVKATLAVAVLDRGGLPAVRQAEQPKDAKSLEEMSIAELEAYIREKETTLPVVPTAPDVAPSRQQTIDNAPLSPPSQGGAQPEPEPKAGAS